MEKINITIEGVVYINGVKTEKTGSYETWVSADGWTMLNHLTIDGVLIKPLCDCGEDDCSEGTIEDRKKALTPKGIL